MPSSPMHPALTHPAARAALDQYLRRATLGLGPEQARDVRDELEEHALGLIDRYLLLGHPPQDALRLALTDLGSPWQVSAALNGVHNMPKMIALGIAGVLAVSAGLYALAQEANTLTLPVLTSGPKRVCVEKSQLQPQLPLLSRSSNRNCYQDDSQTVNEAFVSLTTASKALSLIGAKVSQREGGEILMDFGDQSSILTTPNFKRDGETYITAARLLSSIADYGSKEALIPVTVHGYREPKLRIETTTVRLGGSPESRAIPTFYIEYSHSVLFKLLYSSTGQASDFQSEIVVPTGPIIAVNTGLPAGEVVMAAYKVGERHYRSEVAEVQAGGRITLHSSVPLTFVKDGAGLTPRGSAPAQPTLLVRLSGVPVTKPAQGIFLPN